MKKVKTILLAPDSFKESMTAKEACMAMEKGIKRAGRGIACIHAPMADGGEGTMQALLDATGGRTYKVLVTGPLGNQVEAAYGILGDGKTGILEMSSASGLHLVPPEMRNPLNTTSYGTGQLIKACLGHKINKLLIGIGGSASNDGGSGMIQALGGKLRDSDGKDIAPGGGSLNRLVSIDLREIDARLTDVTIEVACDVNNPLCGKYGASKVFGPQKGATAEMAKLLDINLAYYATVVKEQLHKDIADIPGTGAGGGMGAGLVAYLGAVLKKGIDMVIEYSGLEEKVIKADMVWTGEGCIDYQTQYGKTPMGVAALAKKYNKPVIALAGKIGEGTEILYENGIDSIFGITKGASTLSEALEKGRENLENTAENIMRLLITMDQ